MKIINPPYNPANVIVVGGTIDDTIIGGTTPAAGSFTTLKQTTGAAAGAIPISDAAGALTLTAATGSGAPVRANSPALVTPALGVPGSGTLTSCTGLPQAGIVPGTAANDFLVAGTTPFSFAKKTLAATKTLLHAAPGAIGGTTPAAGTFTTLIGKFNTIEKSADAVSLTALECSGTLVTNRGWDGTDDQTFTLPAAVAGLKFKFLAVVASGSTADTYFDPADGTTKIYLDGTALTDGFQVWTEEIAVGESIVFHTFTLDGTNYDWAADSINGLFANKGS